MKRAFGFIVSLWCLMAGLLVASAAEGYRAGVGRADITPTEPIRLAGYANRSHPSEGIDAPLHVKALALMDPAGAMTLLLTADTIGTPRWFNDELAGRIEKELHVPRERFLFACSHSHVTPVIDGCLQDMYGLTGHDEEVVKAYSKFFIERSVEAAKAALAVTQPVRLSFGQADAAFAANRRAFGTNGVNFGVNPTGLTDHTVPVLRVEGTNGVPFAIVFGYACHCTTMTGNYYRVSGDWAGFAQEYLELTYPGATALFITGCGADANPNPRGQLMLSRQHGLALAGAVARAMNGTMTPVNGSISAAFDHALLPLGEPPAKEDFEKKLTDKAPWVRRHAQRHLDMLARGEKWMTQYPCPVQVLRFGNDLTLVAMGGEVVVDYAYRLRRELPQEHLWPAGYCNDVFAYVPSMRILTEGGYEAEFNLIFYGLPTRFAPATEDVLVKKVIELVGKAGGKKE